MKQSSFEVEQVNDKQITVRHKAEGCLWSFQIGADKAGRTVIMSGKSGRTLSADGPARVVTEALRFARNVARTRGLID